MPTRGPEKLVAGTWIYGQRNGRGNQIISHPNDTAPMPEADFRGVSLLFDELENELVVH